MWVQSLGLKVPLEQEMATHCSILAWEIPRTEEPGQEQCYNGVEHPAVVWRIDLVVAVGKSHTFDVRSTRNKNDSERVFENKGLAEVQSVWETEAWPGWVLEEMQLDS